MKMKHLIVCGLVILLSFPTLNSAILAYEGFDTAFKADLNGLEAGSGFVGNWTVQQFENSTASNPSNEFDPDDQFWARGFSENFVYGSLTQTGRLMKRNNNTLGGASNDFLSTSIAIDTTANPFADGKSIWFSFITDWQSGNFGFAIADSAFDPESKNNLKLFSGSGLGILLDSNDGGGNGSLGVEAALFDTTFIGGQQSNTGTDTINAGAVLYMAELKLNPNGTDDIINVYQVSEAGSASIAASYGVDVDNTTFDTFTFVGVSSNMRIDEIRIGETLADVTAGMDVTIVPEPSSYAFFSGIGVFLALLYRRVRR